MDEITVTQEQANAKVFPFESLRPCETAFIDMRTPGHGGKKNYSIIGAGVTQSSKQFVNCHEPHGYNIGAVSLPVNHENGLHSHFTAEVFIIQSGVWEFFWGSRGQYKAILEPLSIISVPTWVFRGFRCIEEGFMFAALGGDDTGGIIWHPEVVRQANKYGVHLMANNMIVDRAGGEEFPPNLAEMLLFSDAEIQAMRIVTETEMAARISILNQADFSASALLDNCLEGHRASLAPVIGWGLTMDRKHTPPVANPHGFTLEWLRLPPHSSVSSHRVAEKQVLLVLEGELTVVYNHAEGPVFSLSEPGCASIVPGAWREFVNKSDREVIAVVVCGQDGRKAIQWQPPVIEAAHRQGWTVDPGGYIASSHTMRYC